MGNSCTKLPESVTPTLADDIDSIIKEYESQPMPSDTRHSSLICDACIAKGEPARCNHSEYRVPQWSSERKRKIMSNLIKDPEEMLTREVSGVSRRISI